MKLIGSEDENTGKSETLAKNSGPEWLCIEFYFSSPSVAILKSDSEVDVSQSKDTTLKTDTSYFEAEELETPANTLMI